MNILFRRIINGYLERDKYHVLEFSNYNCLPYIFGVKAHNSLDLTQDYEGQAIFLPARATPKNMALAERMRRYARHRATR